MTVLNARPQFLCPQCRLKFKRALKEVTKRRERGEKCYACPGCARVFSGGVYPKLYMFCDECKKAKKHLKEVKLLGKRKKIRSAVKDDCVSVGGVKKKRDKCCICGTPIQSPRRKYCETCAKIVARKRGKLEFLVKAAESFDYFAGRRFCPPELTLEEKYQKWLEFKKKPHVILAKQLLSYLKNL